MGKINICLEKINTPKYLQGLNLGDGIEYDLWGTMIQRDEVIFSGSHSQQSAGVKIQTQGYLLIKSALIASDSYLNWKTMCKKPTNMVL